MSEVHTLTITALAEAYRSKQLSPTEVVETLLGRIERLEPRFNAIIKLDAESVRKEAQACTRTMSSGECRGPLHGVPIGIKDVIDVAGLPTTCHSKILLNAVASRDAEVVARLRAAGAIIFAKLATHEFALGGPSFDLPFPPARNPWNRAYHPGGSSSGAGTAVSLGFMPAAVGTDTAGSIRNPAGACGIVGLKPTYNIVSKSGVFPLAYTLDHVGPMARSVTDIGLILDVIADRRTRVDDSGVKGLRIGLVRHFHEVDMLATPEIAATFDRAAQLLTEAGAVISHVTLPNLNLFSAINRTILACEGWSVHRRWLQERPEDYAESTRRRLLAGAFLAAGDYIHAQRLRSKMIAAVEEALLSCDVLMTANAMDPPCRIDDAETIARTYSRQARTPFNVTGHPAIALMAGMSRSGLPLSVQFVGRLSDEATLLRVARSFESEAGYRNRQPLE